MQPSDKESKYVIFALIFLLANKLQVIGDSFFKEVTTKQWLVLVSLQIMGGNAPTLNDLSKFVGSSHQNVKQLVLKLEQKGYLELSKDENDARRLRIKTTQKCQDFHDAYELKNSKFMNRMFEHLSESDLEITKNIMLTLRGKVEEMEKDYISD
jgi:DNA-binding MarR family transcriptional regulator